MTGPHRNSNRPLGPDTRPAEGGGGGPPANFRIPRMDDPAMMSGGLAKKQVVPAGTNHPPNRAVNDMTRPPVGSKERAAIKIGRSKPMAVGAEPPKKRGLWQRLGGSAFSVSVLAHAIFILLAIFFFIRWVEPPLDPVQFLPGGSGGGSDGSEVAHKIQQKARQRMTPSALTKRVTSTSLTADFTLPDSSADLPELGMPMEVGASSLGQGGGAGGGSGKGIGSGAGSGTGPGRGPGVGRGFMDPNPFGTKGGAGLVGTFYDFKRDQKNKDTGVKAPDQVDYTAIVKGFVKRTAWSAPAKHKHFTADTKLRSKAFTYQLIPDTDAAKAFQCPDSAPGMWVAHYSGRAKVTESGTYRFVGWGDNCMVIGFDSKVVFDASFWHFTGQPRELVGTGVPGHPALPLYSGEWIELRKGQAIKIDVLIGDAGGVFTVGALIEKKGAAFSRAPNGIPNLPLFSVAGLEEEEKALYPFLPAESLTQTLFQAEVDPSFIDTRALR